jgi:hypothetical protein
MKASIFFVIRPVGTELLLQANSAKERDDQASERIIISSRDPRAAVRLSISN